MEHFPTLPEQFKGISLFKRMKEDSNSVDSLDNTYEKQILPNTIHNQSGFECFFASLYVIDKCVWTTLCAKI